jgi:SAM-dependent methyltransferase
MQPSSFFSVPLIDMGSANNVPALEGVLTPVPEVGLTPVGLTKQFLEDASIYHERYTNTSYFKWLIETALARTGARYSAPRILDIGSGSGNSVFPCLEIFQDCRIIATDLSPNLLKILLEHAETRAEARGRVVPVCMDATRDYYQEGSFDLVIGAAILHHLIDPAAALRAAARALTPGGYAIFFEPFENGNSILRLAYEQILEGSSETGAAGGEEKAPLPKPVGNLLRALVHDYEIRRGCDKSGEIYRKIDDKWLFTRSYFDEQARAAGFTDVVIYPIHDVVRPFSRQTEVNLELGVAAKPDQLPGWAWSKLAYYDQAFSLEMKRDLLIEGCVILRK